MSEVILTSCPFNGQKKPDSFDEWPRPDGAIVHPSELVPGREYFLYSCRRTSPKSKAGSWNGKHVKQSFTFHGFLKGDPTRADVTFRGVRGAITLRDLGFAPSNDGRWHHFLFVTEE